MFSKLEGLQTKTFEKDIKLNFASTASSLNALRTAADFNKDLHINRLLRNQQVRKIPSSTNFLVRIPDKRMSFRSPKQRRKRR